MAVYKTTTLDASVGQTLANRDWLSVNVQTVDDSGYDPTIYEVPSTTSAATVVREYTPLQHVSCASVPQDPTAFYSGAHFTYDEEVVDKQDISLGVVSTDVTLSLNFQSMCNCRATVSSVSDLAAYGITVSGVDEDTEFMPYEEKEVSLYISSEGTTLVEAQLAICFEGCDNTFYVTINLFRFYIPQVLSADWAGGLNITRSYLTSIFTAYDGSETRKSLRAYPLLSLSCDVSFLADKSAQQVRNMIRTRASGGHLLPIYPDARKQTAANDSYKIYCDTDYYRFFADGYILVINYNGDGSVGEYEVLRIASVDDDGITVQSEVQNSYTKSSIVCPAMLCYPSYGSDSQSNASASRGVLSIGAQEMHGVSPVGCENPDYAPDTFDDIPMFKFRLNRKDDETTSYSYEGGMEESGRGFTYELQGDAPYLTQTCVANWFSREDWWDLVGFFNYVRGSGKAFWFRDYHKSIFPTATTDTSITVDYTLDLEDWEEIDYLWVSKGQDYQEIVEVTSVSEGTDSFTLTFDEPTFTPSLYSIAMKGRIESDDVEETWITSELGYYSFTFRELPQA